jgi:hypothetical protein
MRGQARGRHGARADDSRAGARLATELPSGKQEHFLTLFFQDVLHLSSLAAAFAFVLTAVPVVIVSRIAAPAAAHRHQAGHCGRGSDHYCVDSPGGGADCRSQQGTGSRLDECASRERTQMPEAMESSDAQPVPVAAALA